MDRKKILVIDDEQTLCSLMEDMLSDDFEVHTSMEGQGGIDLARTHQPNLILLDMVLPDMVGEQIAEALAQDPATQNIPVLLMTAKLYEDDPMRKAKAQPNVKGVLNKPCNLPALLQKIEELTGPS